MSGYRTPGSLEPDEPEPDPRGPWVLQTWVSRRECPDCNVALFAARQEGFRIDACGKCGGAWLDSVTATRAIAERSIVPALLAEQAARAKKIEGAPEASRRCPDCATALVVTRVAEAGIVIDCCEAHGSWFDPGEMRAVIEAIVRRTPPAVDPEVDRVIAQEAARGILRPPETYDAPYGIGPVFLSGFSRKF